MRQSVLFTIGKNITAHLDHVRHLSQSYIGSDASGQLSQFYDDSQLQFTLHSKSLIRQNVFFAVRGAFLKLCSIGSERFACCLCAPGA